GQAIAGHLLGRDVVQVLQSRAAAHIAIFLPWLTPLFPRRRCAASPALSLGRLAGALRRLGVGGAEAFERLPVPLLVLRPAGGSPGAAVDVDGHAGDVAGEAGGEEDAAPAHIVRIPRPAQGHVALERGEELRRAV